MPDNNSKTTTTTSGSGTTSSAGTASCTGAAPSSGATGSTTTTSTSTSNNNTSNTAALSEMITNRDPDLLLCLSRGELPRDRTRRTTRWYESHFDRCDATAYGLMIHSLQKLSTLQTMFTKVCIVPPRGRDVFEQ